MRLAITHSPLPYTFKSDPLRVDLSLSDRGRRERRKENRVVFTKGFDTASKKKKNEKEPLL